MYLVEEFYHRQGTHLGLELVAGSKGLKRPIRVPEAHRPGLSLTGYLKGHVRKRLLVLGKAEIEYLSDLEPHTRAERLSAVFGEDTPAIIVARHYKPPRELVELCERIKVPLFRTKMTTMNLLNRLTLLLLEEFTESATFHGTLVEVYGVGVLIKGSSSIGKSEAALGLIENGHRLISDDTVRIKKREGGELEGFGTELTRHNMEIRGIGIINVAHLYGAVCVRESKSIDIVVELEAWNNDHFYDRFGMDDKHCEILGVNVPYHVLPVKPGRDVVLLLETIALNHRLKAMGYNSAKEFDTKLLEVIKKKQQSKKVSYAHRSQS